MIRSYALNVLGVREALAQDIRHERLVDKSARNVQVPLIPADIAYHSDHPISGRQQKGGIKRHIRQNPVVLLGMGLTAFALMGMLRKSYLNDHLGAQAYMQYRVAAQGFTLMVMCAGTILYTLSAESDDMDIYT